jgi:hypothetical protein
MLIIGTQVSQHAAFQNPKRLLRKAPKHPPVVFIPHAEVI